LMEQSEPLEKNVKTAETDLKEEQQQVDREKESARARTTKDRDELSARQTDRASVVESMDPAVYKEYERVRKKTRNTPIADATEGRCSACQIALRPQFFQDLRRGDKIMFCESCGRFLTYNPVIDIESDVAASQQTA
jgi:uncharacterized protein